MILPWGWLQAYKKITEDFGVDYSSCPIQFAVIEQIVLARNRAQHEERITSTRVNHSKKDLSKYPSPVFISEDDRQRFLDEGISWWIQPEIYINKRLWRQ